MGALQFRLLEATRVNYHTTQKVLLAKTVHDDFYKNKSCVDQHGCSYTEYMVHIIDELVFQAESADQSFGSGSSQEDVQ